MSAIELGNMVHEDTLYFHFNTHQADGTPITLAGTPSLEVYEDGTDAPITAGLTLDVDTGSTPRTGLHEVQIVATTANGYDADKDYSVCIAAGTVDGVSVVGTCIAKFNLEKGFMRGTDSAALASSLTTHDNKLAPISLNGSALTIGGMLTKLADDNDG